MTARRVKRNAEVGRKAIAELCLRASNADKTF